MNIRQWMWCLHCERCFQVLLSRIPKWRDDEESQTYGESPFDFAVEFEFQLGVEIDGQVYAECPYEDCDGDLKDFCWWEQFKEYCNDIQDLPEVPETGKVYSIHTGRGWRRAESQLKGRPMKVDGHFGAGVYSSRHLGLGRGRLIWEIPDQEANKWLSLRFLTCRA